MHPPVVCTFNPTSVLLSIYVAQGTVGHRKTDWTGSLTWQLDCRGEGREDWGPGRMGWGQRRWGYQRRLPPRGSAEKGRRETDEDFERGSWFTFGVWLIQGQQREEQSVQERDWSLGKEKGKRCGEWVGEGGTRPNRIPEGWDQDRRRSFEVGGMTPDEVEGRAPRGFPVKEAGLRPKSREGLVQHWGEMGSSAKRRLTDRGTAAEMKERPPVPYPKPSARDETVFCFVWKSENRDVLVIMKQSDQHRAHTGIKTRAEAQKQLCGPTTQHLMNR